MTAGTLARRLPFHRDRRALILAGCALLTLTCAAAAAAIAASGAESDPVRIAIARGLIVGVPLAVGFFTWSRGRDERFGLLLAAAGGALLVTTLAESGDELAYSVGRTAGWGVELLLVYLILSYPTGRLPGRIDRLLVAAMALVVLTTLAPQLLVEQTFDVPSPYTSCVSHCPPNAFYALEHQSAFVDGVLRPAAVILVVAAMGAVILRLRRRLRDATPLARRMLGPVLAIGLARVALVASGLIGRYYKLDADALEIVAWLIAFAAPAIALAFGLGLVRSQIFAGRALQRLAGCLRTAPNASSLPQAFAEAFRDPTIRLAFPGRRASDRWVDASGHPTTIPAAGHGQSVRELHQDGVVVAVVIHDEALGADGRLLDAGITMAEIAFDNKRLAAQTEAAMREVQGSRARIAASAVRERRRIERDLHDSAQQRLVALRIELELLEDVVREDLERGVDRLQELEVEVDETLEELRRVAHGVYPAVLADKGIAEALRGAAIRLTIPVEVQAHDTGRYSPEVESAVYFCVLEGLQNVLKHAVGVRRVVVSVDGGRSPVLTFSVRDDGAGTPNGSISPGTGITNMRDRLAAVGGEVEIASKPGVGTTVRGSVPTPPAAAA